MIARTLLPIVAIFVGLQAEAKSDTKPEAGSGAKVSAPPEAWTVLPKVRLQPVTVKLGQDVYNPTYYVRLFGGKVIELPPSSRVAGASLSKADAAMVAEDTRYVLESVLRLIQTKPGASAAIINSDYAVVGGVDGTWLKTKGLKIFDPVAEMVASPAALRDAGILPLETILAAAANEGSVGGSVSDAESARVVERDAKTLSESLTQKEMGGAKRLQKFLMFMKEALYTSFVASLKNHRSATANMKQRTTESGYQIAFRGEIQIGIGSLNFVKNFPLMLSIGYNRETRSVVFRRGIRTETMSGGTALMLGGRVEFRRYRMNAVHAFDGDSRKDYAKIRGSSWYPPSIPMISPVADSAHGYHSEGLGFGFNLPSLFAPSTLIVDAAFAAMNTVNAFEETQRIYAIEVPEPGEWMKRLQKKMEISSDVFGGGHGYRCSHLFQPTLINAR